MTEVLAGSDFKAGDVAQFILTDLSSFVLDDQKLFVGEALLLPVNDVRGATTSHWGQSPLDDVVGQGIYQVTCDGQVVEREAIEGAPADPFVGLTVDELAAAGRHWLSTKAALTRLADPASPARCRPG